LWNVFDFAYEGSVKADVGAEKLEVLGKEIKHNRSAPA
jgi:hypothetical protein